MSIPEDRSSEVPIDPFSMHGISGGKRSSAESALDSEGPTPEVGHRFDAPVSAAFHSSHTHPLNIDSNGGRRPRRERAGLRGHHPRDAESYPFYGHVFGPRA